MMNFSFTTTQETYNYCEEIVECLQTYFSWSKHEAIQLVNEYWEDEQAFDDYDLRLHEFPYYWAVCIHLKVTGRNTPNWWKDSSLWPPPQEYNERRLYNR